MRTRTNVSHRALATAESWAEAGYSVRHNAVGEEMWMDETHDQTAIYYTESEVRLNMYGRRLKVKEDRLSICSGRLLFQLSV